MSMNLVKTLIYVFLFGEFLSGKVSNALMTTDMLSYILTHL